MKKVEQKNECLNDIAYFGWKDSSVLWYLRYYLSTALQNKGCPNQLSATRLQCIITPDFSLHSTLVLKMRIYPEASNSSKLRLRQVAHITQCGAIPRLERTGSIVVTEIGRFQVTNWLSSIEPQGPPLEIEWQYTIKLTCLNRYNLLCNIEGPGV